MPAALRALGALPLLGALACGSGAPEVTGVRPVRRDIESALTTNGRIEVEAQATVHAAASGRVSRLLVGRGDSVERGDALAQLADSGQGDARDRAAAELEAARARLALLDEGPEPAAAAVLLAERSKLGAAKAQAQQDKERLERLVSRNAAPRSELDRVKESIAALDIEAEAVEAQIAASARDGRRRELLAAVRSAEAGLREADRSVANLSVRAPRAGTVYSLALSEGGFVSEGSLAARIGDLATLRARIFVDEPDLGRIALGAAARLTADAHPGREWGCTVDRLASEIVVLGARRVGEVLCGSLEPDGALLPNLAVGVRVVIDRAERALSVPREAVERRDGAAWLWVAEEGRAVRREIDVGIVGPLRAEVRRGLDESGVVLLVEAGALSDGQPVSVRMEAGDAAP